ncbi:hypothetical protein F5884DRAFT_492160 [Xylogone sp. PMI_703]|nr:hypothetical protein F5884DRAFT_492160 [Xylogone sp. PMI_703]
MCEVNGLPKFLYHVKQIVTVYTKDRSGATQTTDIVGTFTSLPAAKAAARSVLSGKNYLRKDFELYEESDGADNWIRSDGGVVLQGTRPDENSKYVMILRRILSWLLKMHLAKLKDPSTTTKKIPVPRITRSYNSGRIGGTQTSEVLGTSFARDIALKTAQTSV